MNLTDSANEELQDSTLRVTHLCELQQACEALGHLVLGNGRRVQIGQQG